MYNLIFQEMRVNQYEKLSVITPATYRVTIWTARSWVSSLYNEKQYTSKSILE